MKVTFFVTPLKVISEKNGVGSNGPWVMKDYLFQVVNGEDQISAKTFKDEFAKKIEQSLGQNIEVSFDIKCNEHNGNYYNNINIAYVAVELHQDVPNTGGQPMANQQQQVQQTQSAPAQNLTPEPNNDLPF